MRECEKCGAQNEDNASFCIACSHPLKADDTVGGVDTAPLPSPDPGATMILDNDPNIQLEPGQIFANRYEIIDKIGQGGMGAVYHAKDTVGNNRDIALKLIKESMLVDDKARERLINEGVLTQDIRHPNVVAVHNVGIHQDQPFVAMAYVEGVSMREWLIRNFNHRNEEGLREDIPFLVVAQIIKAILDGLEAAHKLGIVHRDLKPENVILTAEPNEEGAALQILDFGIARAPGPALSTASGGMGTQGYMAPEQLTNPAGVDGSADLYSLSRMFYEMLMRAVPFGQVQDPSGGRTDVPRGIDELIRNGLSDNPGLRPQTVAAYRSALKKAVGNAPIAQRKAKAKPDPKTIPPPPEPTQVPKGVVVGGGIGLAMFTGIAILMGGGDGGGGGEGPETSTGSISTTSSSSSSGDFPPPPPPSDDFSYLGGDWYDHMGVSRRVSVDEDGYFETWIPDGGGGSLVLRGIIPAQEFELTDGNGGEWSNNFSWDRGCHLNYSMMNSATGMPMNLQIHLDHPASQQTCPEKFSR